MATIDAKTDIAECPFAPVAKVIQGKWSLVLVWLLLDETLRFSEIKRAIPSSTDANLTKELRMLENYGIVRRKAYPTVPPKVEYSLTDMGKALRPTIEALEEWSLLHSKKAFEKSAPTDDS